MLAKRTRDIEDARAEVDHTRDKFLRSRGWHHTSNTPGSYWLWCREWGGTTLMVSADTAFAMERNHFEGRLCTSCSEEDGVDPKCPIHFDEGY